MNVDADNPLHFSEICRLCLSKEDMMTPIFEEDDKTKKDMPSLATRILMCASLQVEEGDGFPSQICTKCSGHLDNWYAFKEQCHSSDATLRQHLQTDSKIVMVSKNFETRSRNNKPFQERTPEFFNAITTEEPDVSAFCEVTLTAIDDNNKTNLENKNKMIQSKKSKTNTIKKKVKISTEKGALNNKTTKKSSKRRVKRKRTCVDANESIVLRNFVSPQSSGPSSSTSDPVPVQDKRHTCHICLKSYASRHSLTEHMAWHSGIKTFFCPVCEKGYYSATQLRTHSRTHSSIRPYLCNICGKSYKLDSDLKRHSFIHSELSPYLCNICGKTTNRKSELNVHIQLHSNEKKYLCSDCGRAFKLRSVLKKHSAVHSPEKPEVCKVCDMSFKRKEYLERHMRIHTGENPYICKFCGRAFSGKWNMIQHVRLHTGVKPYVCNVCGEAFTHNVTLRKHAEKHKVQSDTQHLMPPSLYEMANSLQ